mgnify:CR=1 FL=1
MIRLISAGTLCLVAGATLFAASSAPQIPLSALSSPLKEVAFAVPEDAEVTATLRASCSGCDWGVVGRESAVLRLAVDGRYSQNLFLVRGATASDYHVLLGPLPKGPHQLTLSLDKKASSKRLGEVAVTDVTFQFFGASHPDHSAIALAPVLHARPNTLGRFSDVPLLLWYEKEKTTRGSRIRYSAVFSNEDGGTPADRLLATWGRLTDLEYVYGIEFDHEGRVIEETFQGKDHEIVPFRGKREGFHPVLFVITDNNMVKDEGTPTPRFAPAPILFDLTHASRELVMDEHPWTYAVTAQEARREGRVSKAPAPGSKKIFDPRRYAVLEACAAPEDTAFATFSFSLGVKDASGKTKYFDSTAGVKEYRISRSPDNFPNGCFRGAVALPTGTAAGDVNALRVRAYPRPPRKGEVLKAAPGPARLLRVNRLFLMNRYDQPEPSLFSWTGEAALPLDGEPVTIETRPSISKR